MLQIQVIGNLGSDAEVKEFNGNKAVCFNVAHTERWTQEDGTQRESTTWVSCILNGDGGKLLPYLKKGTNVYVEGAGSTRVYSSPKLRQMVAGLNLTVRHIELVGGKRDEVPRELISQQGEIFPTTKAWYVQKEGIEASGATMEKDGILLDRDGLTYIVNGNGYIRPCPNEPAA